VKKINESKLAFKEMENISFFLDFANKHISKTELFQTVDLYEVSLREQRKIICSVFRLKTPTPSSRA